MLLSLKPETMGTIKTRPPVRIPAADYTRDELDFVLLLRASRLAEQGSRYPAEPLSPGVDGGNPLKHGDGVRLPGASSDRGWTPA